MALRVHACSLSFQITKFLHYLSYVVYRILPVNISKYEITLSSEESLKSFMFRLNCYYLLLSKIEVFLSRSSSIEIKWCMWILSVTEHNVLKIRFFVNTRILFGSAFARRFLSFVRVRLFSFLLYIVFCFFFVFFIIQNACFSFLLLTVLCLQRIITEIFNQLTNIYF